MEYEYCIEEQKVKDTFIKILISSDLKQSLFDKSEKQGVPVSSLIRSLIVQYLNDRVDFCAD